METGPDNQFIFSAAVSVSVFCFMLPSAYGIYSFKRGSLSPEGTHLRCVCGGIETSATCSTGSLDRPLLKTVLDNCKALLWQIMDLFDPLL